MKKNFLSKALASAALGGLILASGQIGCAAGSSAQKAQAPAEKSFIAMDVNGDGNVTLEEFKAAYPNMNEQAFVIIDKNGDKKIDQAEWLLFMERHAKPSGEKGAPMNNIPGDPLIPPMDSSDLPLMRPPMN